MILIIRGFNSYKFRRKLSCNIIISYIYLKKTIKEFNMKPARVIMQLSVHLLVLET